MIDLRIAEQVEMLVLGILISFLFLVASGEYTKAIGWPI